MTPLICSDPATMEQLRAILGFGLVLSGAMLTVDYIIHALRKKESDSKD